ncbi:hypothetical protein HPB48_014773 [Haemaphysalis longicornis]|uniref:Uncharacterized protein n=1 Tax=Haemaphysalis longicornis TaxID=44386 RepID=A0A9J6GX78_HAELO|nr:hypothetical protein HPB48_014773 [Haemaphysalis longicornis]
MTSPGAVAMTTDLAMHSSGASAPPVLQTQTISPGTTMQRPEPQSLQLRTLGSATASTHEQDFPVEPDDQEGDWITPGKPRKPRLTARPSFDLHAVGLHLPPIQSGASAERLGILPALIRAAKLPAHTCADISLHLRHRDRLAVVKTHHVEVVNRLLRVQSITLAGRTHQVAPYLMAPTNSCRGVIHGIAPDATPDDLIRDLDCYQSDILSARRMGSTNSAILTFSGTHVPFYVYYQRIEFRCRPHKPRAHHCTTCLQYGHRTLACPGNQQRCPICSTVITQPDEPHACTPWCLHCEGHHAPFAEVCNIRKTRDEACSKEAKKQLLRLRQQQKSLHTTPPPVKLPPPASSKPPTSNMPLPPTATWGGQRPNLPPSSLTPASQPALSAQTKTAPVNPDLLTPPHVGIQVGPPIPPTLTSQSSPTSCKIDQLEQRLTELTSRVVALTSLVEIQQTRLDAQDQRTSSLEALITKLTESLNNLNATISKKFDDAPTPMEDTNSSIKRANPVPASSVGLAPKIKPATLLAPPNLSQ